ncbi:MAG: DegV family protein [Oscillospiraceae bacterium]|nr:DegV family protein [Oscillospiraceae bacterium]
MSFKVFTDSSANLPGNIISRYDIEVIPFRYEINGVMHTCEKNTDNFDCHRYYEMLRNKGTVKTSLINVQEFCDELTPMLKAGQDVLYVGLSSGVSGTVQAAKVAARLLTEEFPERKIRVFDSMGAGLGVGLTTCKAASLNEAGMCIDEAMLELEEYRMKLCQYFTVDDIMFLKRGGRVSGVTAAVGTVLNIKPILRGDEEGHIVSCGKVRGRMRAVEALAEIYQKKVRNAENQIVAISHGDCMEDAERLASIICDIAKPKEILIMPHEPLTGAHVGPGMLALFYEGNSR